jgi:hypothetical protein
MLALLATTIIDSSVNIGTFFGNGPNIHQCTNIGIACDNHKQDIRQCCNDCGALAWHWRWRVGRVVLSRWQLHLRGLLVVPFDVGGGRGGASASTMAGHQRWRGISGGGAIARWRGIVGNAGALAVTCWQWGVMRHWRLCQVNLGKELQQ